MMAAIAAKFSFTSFFNEISTYNSVILFGAYFVRPTWDYHQLQHRLEEEDFITDEKKSNSKKRMVIAIDLRAINDLTMEIGVT